MVVFEWEIPNVTRIKQVSLNDYHVNLRILMGYSASIYLSIKFNSSFLQGKVFVMTFIDISL